MGIEGSHAASCPEHGTEFRSWCEGCVEAVERPGGARDQAIEATRPSSAASMTEKCGAVAPLSPRITCEKPKGHDGAHVCVGHGGTYGWGGTK